MNQSAHYMPETVQTLQSFLDSRFWERLFQSRSSFQASLIKTQGLGFKKFLSESWILNPGFKILPKKILWILNPKNFANFAKFLDVSWVQYSRFKIYLHYELYWPPPSLFCAHEFVQLHFCKTLLRNGSLHHFCSSLVAHSYILDCCCGPCGTPLCNYLAQYILKFCK